MRKFWFLCIPAMLLLGSCGSGTGDNGNAIQGDKDTAAVTGTMHISGTQALQPMMAKWVSEFGIANPKAKLILNNYATEKGIEDLLQGKSDLVMIARPLTEEEKGKGLWSAAVALDAIVPVISFENNYIQPLVMNGLTKEKLAGAFTGKIKNWGALTGRKNGEPVNVFVQSDSSGCTSVWYTFLNLKPGEMKGTSTASEKDMLASLTSNKSGIGYCSIRSIYNMESGFRKEGIYLVPVDFNGSGLIDDNEQFYDNFSLVSNAISTGKLPMPPSCELNIVTRAKPADKLMMEFVKWLLTIGQNYMPDMKYIHVSKEKANAVLETLK